LNEERLPRIAGETTLHIGTECAHPLDSRSGLPHLIFAKEATPSKGFGTIKI
jgi:hypothetical protein